MKRSWMGFVLLLILLCGGILVTAGMDRLHGEISRDLEQAAQAVQRGDWGSADALTRQAAESWKKWEHFRACFADHTPIEDIDADMAQMEVYRLAREEVAFCASCSALSRKVAAVGEAHALTWWNVF